MKKLRRIMFYLLGQLVLVAGLTLSTKVNLGVSAILSVAYSASVITGAPIGNTSLVVYTVCVIAQIVIHLSRKFQDRDRRKLIIADLLQLPLSLVFTRVMNLFASLLPNLTGSFLVRVPLLLLAIVFVGIGAAMTLDMRILPNPADGIVQAISDVSGIKLGLAKNIVDFSCVVLTTAGSLILAGRVIGIHVGTLLSMVGTGRVIALFNRVMAGHIHEIMGEEQSL